MIERLLSTLRIGLRKEGQGFDTDVSLERALEPYYLTAYRLFYLAYLAREAPDVPVGEALIAEEVEALAQMTGQPLQAVADVVPALAKMGGYTLYPSAPPPGVQTLWYGWTRFQRQLEGWRLARGLGADRGGNRDHWPVCPADRCEMRWR